MTTKKKIEPIKNNSIAIYNEGVMIENWRSQARETTSIEDAQRLNRLADQLETIVRTRKRPLLRRTRVRSVTG